MYCTGLSASAELLIGFALTSALLVQFCAIGLAEMAYGMQQENNLLVLAAA